MAQLEFESLNKAQALIVKECDKRHRA